AHAIELEPSLANAAAQLIRAHLQGFIYNVLKIELTPILIGDAIFTLELVPLSRSGQWCEAGKLGKFQFCLAGQPHRLLQNLYRVCIQPKNETAPDGDSFLVQ